MEWFRLGHRSLSHGRGRGTIRDSGKRGKWRAGLGNRGRRRNTGGSGEDANRSGLLCLRERSPASRGPTESWGWDCHSLNCGLTERMNCPARAFPFPGVIAGGKWEKAAGWVQISIVGVRAYQKEVRPCMGHP